MNAAIVISIIISASFVISYSFLEKNRTGIFTAISFAIPTGLAFIILSSLVSTIINTGPWLTFILLMAVLVLAIFLLLKAKSIRNALLPACLLFFANFIFMVSVDQLFQPAISYDSFKQINNGAALYSAEVRSEFLPSLASWGFALISLHGQAQITDDALFIGGLHPLILVGCTLLIAHNLLTITKKYNITIRTGVVVSALGVWLTSAFVIFNSVYIHNQTLTLLFALMVTAVGLLYITENRRYELLILFGVACFCFALTRLEAPIYLCVFLTSFILCFRRIPSSFAVTIIFTSISVVAWYLILLSWIGTGTDILTPSRAMIIILALILVTCLASLHIALPEIRLWRFLQVLMFPTMFVFLGIITFLNPAAAFTNVSSLSINALASGWSYLWYLLIPAILLMTMIFVAGPKKQNVITDHLEHNIATFFLIIAFVMLCIMFGFGLIRIPYRLGWGDSGNRILTIIAPFIICAFISAAVAIQRSVSGNQNEKAGNSFRTMVPMTAAVAILIFLVILPVLVKFLPVKNLAYRAQVLQAHGFIESHPVNEALDGSCDTDRTYAAASSSGSVNVVLDLKKVAKLERVVLCFYPEQDFTDFSFSASEDGVSWNAFYNSLDDKKIKTVQDNNLWQLLNYDFPSMRFFKLEYNASIGQNRFLLRGIKLIEQ